MKLGEATPGFDRTNTEQMLANAEKRAVEDLEESKKMNIEMTKIAEIDE